MNTENLTQNIQSVFANPLNKTFNWFKNNFVPKINETISEFWGESTVCRLVAVFDDDNNIFKGEELFVTKVLPPSVKKKNENSTILVKLSRDAVKMFVESVLGNNNFNDFYFENITELEGKIISEFNYAVGQNLFSLCMNQGLQDVENKTKYNLLFYIRNSKKETGKLYITIPACMIDPVPVAIHQFYFDLNNFIESTTVVNIAVGKSLTTLKDLRQLEVGDMIVLEDSRIDKMTLYIDGEVRQIKVNPDPSLIVNTEDEDENDEDDTMGVDISKDMWDTIQVEIGAEFEKIKITLGELKQISEGLVVDIGSVYDNKINLKVENKTIASGELVIINDRYGIRIDELVNEEDTPPTTKPSRSAKSAQKNVAQETDFDEEDIEEETSDDDEEYDEDEEETESGEDDEFDYSDFDVDEEDI